MLIRSGNTIRTVAEARNILATAVVDESFPQDFGIYDLNEFIGVLGLVDTPRLKFEDSYVVVGDSVGRSKVKYFFSAEENLTSPAKDISMPESVEVSFVLTNDILNKLKRAASTLGHDQVSITNKNGVLTLSVVDSENSTSNTFSMDIDGEFKPDAQFNIIMNISNIKILPGDYDVQLSSKKISQFKNREVNVTYWIAIENRSVFGV
jgi:hypothetical protein